MHYKLVTRDVGSNILACYVQANYAQELYCDNSLWLRYWIWSSFPPESFDQAMYNYKEAVVK